MNIKLVTTAFFITVGLAVGTWIVDNSPQNKKDEKAIAAAGGTALPNTRNVVQRSARNFLYLEPLLSGP